MSSNVLRSNEDLELGSMSHLTSFHFHEDHDSGPNSLRSSLEDDCYYQRQDCTIHIHDDLPINSATEAVDDDVLGGSSSYRTHRSPEELRERLDVSILISYSCYNDTELNLEGPGSDTNTMDVSIQKLDLCSDTADSVAVIWWDGPDL